jgi:hypothetical protein
MGPALKEVESGECLLRGRQDFQMPPTLGKLDTLLQEQGCPVPVALGEFERS